MIMNHLEKEIVNRVKRIKCEQSDCRSSHQETLQIVVVPNQQNPAKREGIMCTSCYIDHELLSKIGNAQLSSLSVQKFLKVLTESYSLYAQQKSKPQWPPNLALNRKQQIREKVSQLEKTVAKGIVDIMKFLDDSIKNSTEAVKKSNTDKSLQKLVDLINQEDQQEQERINVNNEIKDITSKLRKDHGSYKLITQEQTKKLNEAIMIEYKKKALKAKAAISKLIQTHKKCLKYLIQ